jgi:Ras GTPase-activating-like protein IQGAP2/3
MTLPAVRPAINVCCSLTDADTAQKVLRDLKSRISSQSKKNFVLEKDVRYLDSRIALLVQNRMALEEVRLEACHTFASTG